MNEPVLTLDEVRAMAAQVGLVRLSDEHLVQLLRATLAARARSKKLGSERLGYADEPAHVYRLDDEARR